MEVKTLIEERAKNWERMKALMDEAEKRESKRLEAGEVEEYEKLEADVEEFSKQIDMRTRHEARETALEKTPLRDVRMLPGGEEPAGQLNADEEKRMAEYRRFLVTGEHRSLQADSDTEGGFLLAPQTLAAALIANVKNQTFVRQMATVEAITQAQSLGVVSLDTDFGAADWTQELTQSTVDEALRLGKRELKPIPLTKETKLSRTLVRRTAGKAEDLVLDRLGYQFGVTNENAFLNGTGANQPLGVFTASAQGVSTARDVSTGNTTTEIRGDGLIEAQHTLKGQYWGKASWLFHRDAVKQIRKLKTGDGQYIWTPGLNGGLSNQILGMPYVMSEYAPNTFTTGLYVGILADWSFYWIVDALALEIQVLNELYARTNQYGYIGRMETDGMPVLEEAFVRVKLA